MKKGVGSIGLVCMLVTAGFLGMIGLVDEFVEETKGITVPVDYPTIQDAINNSIDGDTIYVWTGMYYENIVVNKTLTIIGNGTANTTIDGSSAGDVVSITADWVNVTGFTVTNGTIGIRVNTSVSYARIEDNNVTANSNHGISLVTANNISIRNNIVFNNSGPGIYIWRGNDNNVTGNNVTYNNQGGGPLGGIYTEQSDYNWFEDNYVSYNPRYGINLYSNSNNNTVIDNDIVFNCGGDAGLYIFSSDYNYVFHNRVLNSTGVGISVYGSSYCVVFNNSVMGNAESAVGEAGLYVRNGDYNDLIQNNVSYNNYEGIYIYGSTFTDIIDNTVIGNAEHGISLDFNSDNNTIHNNTIFNNTGAGIYIVSGNDNNITGNNVTYNNQGLAQWGGIYTEQSDYNWFEDNYVSNNPRFGIHIYTNSNNNTVIDNDIVFNCGGDAGINVEQANYNYIIDNRVLNSTGTGIELYFSNNCVIFNNSVKGNAESMVGSPGLKVWNSDYNDIIQNNISFNNYDGIKIYSSSFNDIIDNTIIGNAEYGIFMDSTDNTTIHNNTIFNNSFAGIFMTSSNDNNVTGNNVTYNNQMVTPEGGIILVQSDYNWFENNYVSNNPMYGIQLSFSSNNTIVNNDVVFNCGGEAGINIQNSDYNYVLHNRVLNSTGIGIQLYVSSNCVVFNNSVFGNAISVAGVPGMLVDSGRYNDLIQNNVSNNNYDGIYIIDSSFTDIIYNTIQSNLDRGISLFLSDNTTISGNDITGNDGGNINLSNSIDNEIYDNLISSSVGRGVYIDTSSIDNLIYHNNFVGNAEHAYDEGVNTWNLAFPFGGNWWDDWTVPDLNFDGFVDNPRVIPGAANQDDWPFTTMDGWLSGNWFNKSAFSNYAPSGMPDFDQRERNQTTLQNYWMTMNAGPDGILDPFTLINILGDDVLVNGTPGQNNVSIAPGDNHMIDTPLMGDDTLEFSYCGPTAAADALWWLDSRFADPSGFPGDGNDIYSLITDLGVGDDHSLNNVDRIIEDLAVRFNTINEGDTNVSRMVDGLNQHLSSRNQAANYSVNNIPWPIFDEVATEVNECNVAILFIGFYDSEGNRTWGHIVTVSGANTVYQKIGISDPIVNDMNPIATYNSYNDTYNVSHDMYDVMPGPPPVSNPPPSQFWLFGYNSGYSIPIPMPYYAVVEDVVIIAPHSVPGAPTGLTPANGSIFVNITWTPPADDGGSPIINYIIYRGTSPGVLSYYTMTGNLTYFNDTVVSGGVTYYYTVSAVNSVGEGPQSGEIDGTPVSIVYTVDYINITDTPDGSDLAGGTVPVGFMEWGNCSTYNITGGFLGTVSANWSNEGGDSSLLGATPAVLNGINVGGIGGDVWLNASYAGLNASVQFTVLAPTVDYIEITDIPNGTPLADKTVGVGFSEWGNCSAYNSTIGFISTVNATWTAYGGNSSLLGPSPEFLNGIYVGTMDGVIWLNASFGGINDSVQYTVLPPTVDYIEITDIPDGMTLTGGSVPIGFIAFANCSAYNDSIGYIGIRPAGWTAEGGNSSLIGSTPSSNISIDVGNATGDVWLNASFSGHNTSILYIVIPRIDYIEITYITNGTPIVNASVPVGLIILANCSAYNSTIGYLSNVTATWTAQGTGGAVPILGPTPAVSSWIDVGLNSGTVWFNASFGGLTDSVMLTIIPPTLDYIGITDIPGGASIIGGSVPVGFLEWGNCSAYNNTAGYIFTVNANWSAVGFGGASPSYGPTPAVSSWVNVGTGDDLVLWNASYFDGVNWHNDSVAYNVLPPTADYIEITTAPGGPILPGATVLIDFIEFANCSAYNDTVGFIGTVSANWTAEGGNASLMAATPSIENGINVGNVTGTVWLNASYDGYNFSVQYTVTGITIDYIEITDIPNGTNLVGGIVPVGFSVWGNCSAYNSTIGYIGTVEADWSAQGGSSSLLGITTPAFLNGMDAGTTAGIIWFNATYGGLSDSVQYLLSPPTEPQALVIISGESFINISWEAPDSNGSAPVTGYTLYRGNASGVKTPLTFVTGVLFFNDTSVENGKMYYYVISANNSLGEGALSVEVSATAGAVPSQPQNVIASAGDSVITLTWSAPATDGGLPVINYRIYKGTASGSEVFEVDVGAVLTYDDLAVSNGITYYYKVTAENTIGEGAFSDEKNDTPKGPPSSPHSLTVKTGDTYVYISWSEPTLTGGSAITNYNIYRGTVSGNLTFIIQVDNVLAHNDTGLTNNETYFYTISAVNGVGEGPESNEVNGTPEAPVIPINEPPVVEITKPVEGAEVFGLIEIAGSASDTDGSLEMVQIRIDDGNWIDLGSGVEWSYQIDTTNLSNGPHTIYVRSYDGEDYSEEASITIEVDNPAEPKEKSVFEEAWFWAFIILVIIILLVLFFMVFAKKIRERPEKEYYDEEEEEEEEDEWEDEDEEPDEESEDEEEPEEELEDEAGDELDLEDDIGDKKVEVTDEKGKSSDE